MGDEQIVSVISQYGVPVLIASDTSPPSHFVRKVAARFNVKVFHPNESLSKIEKREIGKKLENQNIDGVIDGMDDPHIRDSYAAAVKAYRKYQNRLRQIDSMDVDAENKELLKKTVILGQRISEKLLPTL